MQAMMAIAPTNTVMKKFRVILPTYSLLSRADPATSGPLNTEISRTVYLEKG